jgi:hypothetical protein
MADDKVVINIEQAKAEIGGMVRAFRAFREAENIVHALEHAVQVQAETDQAISTAKRKLTIATKDVDAAKEEATRIRDEARFELEAAKAERERAITDAKTEAEVILSEAGQQVAALNASRDATVAEIDSLVAKAAIVRAEVERLEQSRATVLEALTGATSRIAPQTSGA